ncbi:hypothetical protein [Sandaracinus amylolyticus]|nr:hypothetical protein [Sandaracinus amylolyticus]
MDYDMAGLAMYDDAMGLDGGMSGPFITGEMLKQKLMAAGAGALGIAVAAKLVSYVGDAVLPEEWEPKSRATAKSALAIALGLLGGRALYDTNRDAAMGLVGGVAGLGIAQLLGTLVNEEGAEPLISTSLAGSHGISSLDLAALESAVVTTSPSFTPMSMDLAAPVVTERRLGGPVVTNEVLAEYMPYLS